MSTVHGTEQEWTVVVGHSFVQSGTREPNLRELYEERLVDNEMATCIYDCHPKTLFRIDNYFVNQFSLEGKQTALHLHCCLYLRLFCKIRQ